MRCTSTRPGAYVLEPDPAVVRAQLVDELACALDAWRLDAEVAYLSTAALALSPFARTFAVLAVHRYDPAALRRALRQAGWRPVEIMKRRFPVPPEEVRRQLGAWQAGEPVTLIMTRLEGRPTCIVCQEVSRSATLRSG